MVRSRAQQDGAERASGTRPRHGRAAVGREPRAQRPAPAPSPRWRFSRLSRAAKARVDLIRRLLAPLVLALVPLFWVADATHRSSLTTLGRDQGIFQYIAWAVRNGAVDYRDVRDVNGPLVHLIHMVFLALGGARRASVPRARALGDRRCRSRFVGACIPGLVTGGGRAGPSAPRGRPRRGSSSRGAVPALPLLEPGAARELLRLVPPAEPRAPDRATGEDGARRGVAHRRRSPRSRRSRWFGKPSFVALHRDAARRAARRPRRAASARARRSRASCSAARSARSIPLAYLLRYGDARAFARISLRRRAADLSLHLGEERAGDLRRRGPAHGGGRGHRRVGAAPRRSSRCASCRGAMLVIALAPLCGHRQRRGPAQGLRLPLPSAHRVDAHRVHARRRDALGALPRGAATRRRSGASRRSSVSVGLCARGDGEHEGLAAHSQNVWILAGGETPERAHGARSTSTPSRRYDFFPWELRQAATYLAREDPAGRARAGLRHGSVPPLPRAAAERDAVHLRVRPQRRRRARRRLVEPADRGSTSERIRAGARDARAGHARAPAGSAARGVRLHRQVAAHHVSGRMGGLPPLLLGDGARGSRDTTTRAKSFGEVHVWFRDDLPVTDNEMKWP